MVRTWLQPRAAWLALILATVALGGCLDKDSEKRPAAAPKASAGATRTSEVTGLRLCNMTPSRVGVAIGYRDKNGWTTEGWWNVPSHSCETLLEGPLNARYYYIHAVDYDRGGEWSDKAMMCTSPKKFTIRQTEDCAAKGYETAGFIEVDTKESRGWTIRLTDPS